jgi:hypothetical protein
MRPFCLGVGMKLKKLWESIFEFIHPLPFKLSTCLPSGTLLLHHKETCMGKDLEVFTLWDSASDSFSEAFVFTRNRDMQRKLVCVVTKKPDETVMRLVQRAKNVARRKMRRRAQAISRLIGAKFIVTSLGLHRLQP